MGNTAISSSAGAISRPRWASADEAGARPGGRGARVGLRRIDDAVPARWRRQIGGRQVQRRYRRHLRHREAPLRTLRTCREIDRSRSRHRLFRLRAAVSEASAAALRASFVTLAVLWLAGADLRLTVLAVPPVLPLIHHDLAMSEKAVGALSSLPVLLLGLGAVPGSLLIARLGARRAAILALLVVAAAGAARGLGPSLPMLFAMTLVMGAGVAVLQPALP